MISFAYFIVQQVIGFIAFSLSQRDASQLTLEMTKYFICERNGHDPSNPCDRTAFERFQHPTITLFSYGLYLLTPLVNMVYVVDFQFLRSKMSSKKGNVIERQNISASNAATNVSIIIAFATIRFFITINNYILLSTKLLIIIALSVGSVPPSVFSVLFGAVC